MADEKLSLHIDDDWKKQAQEEKRKLAEQQKQAPTAPATSTASAPSATGPASGPGAASSRAAGRARELPPPSFAGLIQSLTTQILYYLGDLAPRGGEESVNLDMAKHQIDTLAIIEDKTKGNLTLEEQRLLDAALYETRMRYVSVASQYT